MTHPDAWATMSSEIRHLFVYGTLRPGDVRWPLLEPFVADDGWRDSVAGRLYDTGLGYPAAVLDHDAGSGGTIFGQTYALVEPSLDHCLAVLDAEEASVRGGYHRVTTTTATGTRVFVYECGAGLDLVEIESGDWLSRGRYGPGLYRPPGRYGPGLKRPVGHRKVGGWLYAMICPPRVSGTSPMR